MKKERISNTILEQKPVYGDVREEPIARLLQKVNGMSGLEPYWGKAGFWNRETTEKYLERAVKKVMELGRGQELLDWAQRKQP